MTTNEVTDEMLMAFVDGEVDAPTHERIETLAASDSGVAQRIERFRVSRIAVHESFAGVLDEPVPERLLAAVGGETPRRPPSPWGGRRGLPASLAAAASVAVVAGMAGFLAGQWPSSEPVSLLAAATGPEILTRLAATPSGTEVTVETMGLALVATPLGSFPSEAGPCRLFEVADGAATLRGLTCLTDGEWRVPVILETAGAGAYVTASDAASSSIDAYLDAIGAGAALDPAAEEALLAAGWQD